MAMPKVGIFSDMNRSRFRPAINLGALLDIPTGHYVKGVRGESILNAGLSPLTGIGARPNNFKSALAILMLLAVRRAFHYSENMTFDTEGTLPAERFNNQARFDEYLSAIDFKEDPQSIITDVSAYTGDEFWKEMRSKVAVKSDPKTAKDFIFKTPFADDRTGEHLDAVYPSSAMIDSFTKLQTSGLEAMYDKNMIGASGNNTDAMSQGKAKAQLLNQVPQMVAKNGLYMILTALMGDVIEMDMYAPDKRNLALMPKNTNFRGVSPQFYSAPNNLWCISSNRRLLTDKMPEYPFDNKNAMKGDTDLCELGLVNLRAKNGISGIQVNLVVSQSEGVKVALSQFHYCKTNERFGLGGNVQNYFFELCPDVSLSRTKVRGKLENEPRAARAAEFTADLLQMIHFHRNMDQSLMCEPKELYEDLKAMGYDWEVLYNTRSYWTFMDEEDEHKFPFLSTMDLLNMRKGTYVPFWFTKEQRQAIDLTKAKV